MSRTWYINGEASVASDVGGGGLEELGISVDGVSIIINEYTKPIYTDTFGESAFGETQYFLQDITIKATLVYFDYTILQVWLTGLPGRLVSSDYGTFGSAGDLLVLNGGTARLLIRSTPSGSGLTGQAECYNFPYAYLADAQETKLGTVRSVWDLTWKAISPYQASSTNGLVLWNNICD